MGWTYAMYICVTQTACADESICVLTTAQDLSRQLDVLFWMHK